MASMYVSKIFRNCDEKSFDWDNYFKTDQFEKIFEQIDLKQMVLNLREHLKESRLKMAFALNIVMTRLLKGYDLKNSSILELGAATGLLSRWLIQKFKGTGVLVDSSQSAFRAFKSVGGNVERSITYLIEDIFNLNLIKKFDVVCSFGLIEHFREKRVILDIHKKFAKPGGFIIILIPFDTPSTRAFFELNPQLNLGYRELLTRKELSNSLKKEGLEIKNIQVSHGYVYDFIAALCQKKS